jgi:tetratricopeptide (TPR) repeat protein
LSYLSWLRQRVGPLTLGLAVIALLTVVCVVASIFFAFSFVRDTIALVAGNLASRSGVSLFLVKAVVIVGTIPFFWAVGKFTKNVWGLMNLGWDSLALYKSKYGLIIVGYVGLYFFVMYGASLQAYEYKLCANTPEGIFTADSPGKDPVYGVELKPCTRAQILEIRAGGGYVRGPREISIVDVENYEWFDRVTGQPRVWYSMAGEHAYRFFDWSGVDPHSREVLKSVTPDFVAQIKREQTARLFAIKVEKKKAADAELKHTSDAQQNQKQAEMSELSRVAESSFELKDYKSAIDTCSKILETDPRNQTCITVKQHASVKLADQLVSLGLAQWEKGEFDEAKWRAEKALDLDPSNQGAIKLKTLANQLKARVSQ